MRDTKYFDANTPKVAAVVGFYMCAALVVSTVRNVIQTPAPNERTDGVCVRRSNKRADDINSISERRNKAVLNGSPDLPLLFLLLQLLIAVLLLHVAAAFIARVEIPKLELETAKKLTPVVLVNVIGLVFNTLCLRDVEASFFQVCGLSII
jgi:GDP-fucose transporter C1